MRQSFAADGVNVEYQKSKTLRFVFAGCFQLQRIVSRCTCQMYYVGYESLVDSEQTDYAHLLPETPMSPEEQQAFRGKAGSSDIMTDEKPSNVLTVLQPDLEICTNAVAFNFLFCRVRFNRKSIFLDRFTIT